MREKTAQPLTNAVKPQPMQNTKVPAGKQTGLLSVKPMNSHTSGPRDYTR